MFKNCHISHILSCQNEPVKFADFCTTQVEIDVRLGLSSTLLELLSHGDRSYPGAPVFLHCALDTRESHRKPAAVGFMLRYAIAMYMNYAEDMSKLRESSEIYIALLFCMNVCHPHHPKARKNQSRKKFGKLMARTGSCWRLILQGAMHAGYATSTHGLEFPGSTMKGFDMSWNRLGGFGGCFSNASLVSLQSWEGWAWSYGMVWAPEAE